MLKQRMGPYSSYLTLLILPWFASTARAQTSDDVTKLIARLVDLDSIDLCKFEVKYRAGLEPSLASVDADETGMMVLKNPYEVQVAAETGKAGSFIEAMVKATRDLNESTRK